VRAQGLALQEATARKAAQAKLEQVCSELETMSKAQTKMASELGTAK
jgi:hypothetical protein